MSSNVLILKNNNALINFIGDSYEECLQCCYDTLFKNTKIVELWRSAEKYIEDDKKIYYKEKIYDNTFEFCRKNYEMHANKKDDDKYRYSVKLISIDEEIIQNWLTILNIDGYSELDKHYFGYRTIVYLDNEYLSLATIAFTPIFYKDKIEDLTTIPFKVFKNPFAKEGIKPDKYVVEARLDERI